jgi:hypothetical protein
MPSAIYLPEARDDIDEAFESYERRRAGLGDRFLEALERRIETIEANRSCTERFSTASGRPLSDGSPTSCTTAKSPARS